VSAWLCEFARADGLAGFVRLDVRDALAWYWTYLVGVPGHDGVVVVRDHEVLPPRNGLEIRAEGLWAELWCEAAGEHWTFGLEAFGIRLDAPEEALRPGGEIGERVAVGLDLEWETPDIVHGDVLVGRERWTIEARGRFVEGHPLADDPVAGDERARVLIPLDDGRVCERTLVRDASGALRWSQRIWA
jgi:hypothetical protein